MVYHTGPQGDSTAPNWEHVQFRVECPRCGRSLAGLSEPRCPQCELQFAWAELIPADELKCVACGYRLFGLQQARCPECGREFTWPEVFDDYRRRKSWLFEYRWRDRPFRSAWRTWLAVLRPGRLWREMRMQDEPRVGALLVLGSCSAVLFNVLCWLC